MKQANPTFTLGDLAREVGGALVGDGSKRITGMGPFLSAGPDEITFLDPKNQAMVNSLPGCRAGAVIVDSAFKLPAGMSAIRVDPPHLGLAKVLDVLYPRRRPSVGISPAAHVSPGATFGEGVNIFPGAYIGEGVKIGSGTDVYPGCYIGAGATIGSDSLIHANVTIHDRTEIGSRVVIHSGAVIGADGFGYTQEPFGTDPREPARHRKIAQVGKVVIEDDVEIGANSTVDRATLDATVIGRGTKIDNLVMVAHNCNVGRHCLIIAQAGISGSNTLGNYVTIAGQAGMVGHITIGDRAVVTAQAGVTKDVEEGKVVIGAPAMDIREGRLAFGLIARLPELKKSITDLLKRVDKLEKSAGG